MAVFGIITFHTNHFAIKAKKVLEGYGKKPELTNIPRELSSDCGFCCKIPWEEKEESEEILKENSVEFDCIYQWERNDYGKGKEKFGLGKRG
jgi:hypothetical protein